MMPKHELHTDSTNKIENYYQIIMNPKNWKYLKNINEDVIKEFENIGMFYTDDFYKNELFEELEKQIKDKQENIKKTFLLSSSTVRAYVGEIKSLIYIIKAIFNEDYARANAIYKEAEKYSEDLISDMKKLLAILK